MSIDRRHFLKTTGLATLGYGLSTALPFSTIRAAEIFTTQTRARADTILVAVNLIGGNDGLDTIIPCTGKEYDLYKKLRPILKKDKDRLQPFKIPSVSYAFNPAMAKLHKLYTRTNKPLAIIAGVGVPKNSASKFDHAAAMYDFASSDPLHQDHLEKPTGFLGRVLDRLPAGRVPIAVDFGGGSLMLQGTDFNRRPLSISSIDNFQMYFGNDDEKMAYRDIMSYKRKSGSAEEINRLVRKDALASSSYIRKATKKYPTQQGLYPKPEDNWLAAQLNDVAKMIWARLGIRAFSAGLGGFDTHSLQDQDGYHDKLLNQFSEAVYAFYTDIRRMGLGKKVVTMVYSEFGRRPEENSDRGTDHGYGGVMFVLGDSVKGGFYGRYPSLQANKLILDGNLPAPVDYRRVYATLIANHFDVDPKPIVNFTANQGIDFM